MKNKITIFMIIVIIISISILGISYAYLGNNDAQIVLNTNNLEITYDNGNEFNGKKILPGWSSTKTFIIKNNSNSKIYYDIKFVNLINEFIEKSELVYSISGIHSVAERIAPSTDTKIITNIEIEANDTHTYTLNMKYLESYSNQSKKQTNNFTANIEIEENHFIGECIKSEITNLKDCILNTETILTTNPDYNNVSTNNDTGLYTYNENGGTTYYFRGSKDLLNNNVIFAGFQWKIIRIDSNGNIKLIYNGKCENNNCGINSLGESTEISMSKFNELHDDIKYVGYTYDNQNSTIKKNIENWYQTNLSNYDSLIADIVYCNDRTFTYNKTHIVFGSTNRLSCTWIASNCYNSNVVPNLSCANYADRYTKANGKLSEKIGLITADEAALAGSVYNLENKTFYLYSGKTYWTMSPQAYYEGATPRVWDVYTGGFFLYFNDNERGVRPVIALNSNIEISGGDGSSLYPYIISQP